MQQGLENAHFVFFSLKQEAVGDGRARPPPVPPPRELDDKIRVVIDSGLYPPLYGNVTSSTKPEVHNVSHRRQSWAEPRPHVPTEHLVKFERVIF